MLITLAFAHNGEARGIHMHVKIAHMYMRDIASLIELKTDAIFRKTPDYRDKELLRKGLSCVAGYLMIPYGKQGLDYVKEKIYPQTIEDFMAKRLEILLDGVGITKHEECASFIEAAYEYCKNYTKTTLPLNEVSATLLYARYESERSKVNVYKIETPRKLRDIDHAFDCARQLQGRIGETLDMDDYLKLTIEQVPEEINDFEFSDEHRKVIDGLPIFTMLSGN